MAKLFMWVGRVGGVAGLLLSVASVLARFRGTYNLAGFQVGTLLLAGIAAMVVGCLGYLAALAEGTGK
ncbi:MAG: hypothetical protein E6H78_13885 [Betaproteobacteria bacterium]|nr:MAG: hypothetical protein E6H78_13885 [Betaproteobacteria bacterium]